MLTGDFLSQTNLARRARAGARDVVS